MPEDRRTGLQLPDPDQCPVSEETSVSRQQLTDAFEELILSASGWRKIFAADGDEDSANEKIRTVDTVLVGLMGLVYERYFRVCFPEIARPVIAVGIDTRDTGPRIADAIIRVLTAQGVKVRYLFVAAAPEIMAYAGQTEDVDGFIYVSASHNPRGHNGVKFGFADGAVLGGEDSEAIRELFRQTAYDQDTAGMVVDLIRRAPTPAATYRDIDKYKEAALETYRRFAEHVVSGGNADLLEILSSRGALGLVVDFNGSARSVSIDRDFLKRFDLAVRALNDRPRQIAHQIVPEGAGLDACRRALEEAHASSAEFSFGYVPDNDGDRGNLVYVSRSGKASTLHAQETFALACVAELSWLVYTGKLEFDRDGRADQKVALVVNGPTSLRIDRIAEAFDAHVYRAEVGEANVVSLARVLRSRGFLVPVLGEGSNGGNITHPSTVRDPLATVGAVLKLLVAPSRGGRPSPFDIWLGARRRLSEVSDDDFERSLPGFLDSLPRFATTSAFESRAKLQISSRDHGTLKSEYERVFRSQWKARREDLEHRFGIRSWVVINYEGTNETHGIGRGFRTGAERGGFKVLFKNDVGRPVAFLWMRGSGTEPVFRVMVDVENGTAADEAYLLDWHTRMIRAADEAVG